MRVFDERPPVPPDEFTATLQVMAMVFFGLGSLYFVAGIIHLLMKG